MKRSRTFNSALIALMLCSLSYTQAVPADDSGSVKLEEVMALYLKLASPGPEHEILKSQVGTWKTSAKVWAGTGEPMANAGAAEITSILGGRFLREEYKGTMMGMPFEGFRLTGYDKIQNKYITTWLDNLGTGMMVLEGTAGPGGRTITWKGMHPNPMTGVLTEIKMVTRIVDDGRIVALYENRDGKEVKSMEITYTRK